MKNLKLGCILLALMGNLTYAGVKMNKTPKVELKTNYGKLLLELDSEKAPKTVENFLSYVKSGYYDGTVFHRIIDQFMIQGGGYDKELQRKGKTNPPVQNEADNGLVNDIGTIAMARTSDVHSATSQFFINVNKNSFLNFKSKDPRGYGYAVFGKVVGGMDVVNRIKGVPTGSKKGMQDVPLQPVVIESVKILDEMSKETKEAKL